MSNGNHDERRPDPEALLEAAEQAQHGRLKVFLGAAPGVGKTYAMLEAAQARKHEGVDVVAGVVETHGRPETEALLEGIEVVARRRVDYRGKLLEEMDLDALRARRPQLVLVDELAHTNAPGSRHPKRYMDVEELLAAGIDVYTTVNIQHVESLNDVVAQITGVQVHETVPDSILERASEIELIDLSPEELLQRLREGKVYVPDQAERAIRHYFRPGNLTALRELALRRTADRVDDQMRTYMQAHAIPGPWPAQDRLMVCVSASPLSSRLVRAAKRMADRRRAEWLALYVETPGHYRLTDADRDRVAQTLRLAQQLGAETVTVAGEDVAEDVIRFAQAHNVTDLIVGKSLRPRWAEICRGSVVHEIIRRSGHVDVYVISEEEEDEADGRVTRPAAARARVFPPDAYFASALAVVLAILTAGLLNALLSPPNLSIVFLLAVLYSAVNWGLVPSIFASVLSVLAYDFFFVPPFLTLTVASPQDILALMVFLVVAVLTSNLAARVRDQAEAARRREAKTAALYALGRKIAAAAGLDEVVQAISVEIAQTLGARVAVLLPEGDRLVVKATNAPGIELSEAERAAAVWAWQHNEPTGRGTDTLAGREWLYLPLHTTHDSVGVLGLRFEPPDAALAPDERRLSEALASQAAMAIERTRLVQDMEQARLSAETDRLRDTLLSSISHDLRTPLVSITGAVTSLLADETTYDETARRDLLLTIQEEADRLNRLVGNLLSMTRVESGALSLNRDWVLVDDVIGAALARLSQRLSQHRLVAEVEAGLPMLRLDFVLMEQVLVNVLDNAAKFSPPGTTIRVAARRQGQAVVVEVADEGAGVPAADIERIFDKFYRVMGGDRQGVGTGLGLSICRGIVEAHGGSIQARSPAIGDRGTVVTIILPVEKEPQPMVEKETANE